MNAALSEAAHPVADARAWAAPIIDGAALPASRNRWNEEQRENERRLYAEAEKRGHAAGLAAGKCDIDARVAALEERARSLEVALASLSRPLAQLDDQVHEQIAMLAQRIARAVLRRELRTDPTQVIGIVRETVALLPAAARGVRVVLHPEDAALVRERVAPSGPEAAWSIIDDPMLARGDCRVHTDYAQLDARLEARLNEALAALIGEERMLPRGEQA
jgi:flagellar assembly protein FliH